MVNLPNFALIINFKVIFERYLNDGDYLGGFEKEDLDGLFEMMDNNYLGWSRALAPLIMGNAERPELGERLTNSFCATDPEIAKQFARVMQPDTVHT